MFVDSIDSINLSNREFLFSIGRMQLSIGLLHPISKRTCLFELLNLARCIHSKDIRRYLAGL